MIAGNDIRLRVLWLALVLLIPSVFLHQLVPHHHAAPEHTHAGEVPEPVGQLPHSHSGQDDAPDHDCRLTGHLDSHDFAKPARDHDFPAVVTGFVDTPAFRSSRAAFVASAGPAPAEAPLTRSAPRAPPHLG